MARAPWISPPTEAGVVTRRTVLLGAGAAAVGLALAGDAVLNSGFHADEATVTDEAEIRTRAAVGAANYRGGARLGSRRVVWSTPPTGPYAAITFDDGPHPDYTPRVLDALASAGVRATFNVVGFNAVQHTSLLLDVVAAGHDIGNHTWSHLRQSVLGPEDIRGQIVRCKDEVEQVIQRPLVGFRPPGGELTGYGLLVCADLGYDVFLWSCTRGPSRTSTPHTVAEFIGNTVRPGDILDLHDGLGRGEYSPEADFSLALAARREVEMKALPEALERVADRGIILTTVTELLARTDGASG